VTGTDVLGGDGTPGTALARYDALPPTDLAQLRGTWRGRGIPTGHRLDGVLERLGWYGKRFDDEERVHPLLFRSGRRLVSVNPAVAPLGLALRCAPALRTAAAGVVFPATARLVATTRPHGRLRAVRYRGVVSAALVYDDLPVLDVFRTVDDATVVGAMDARGMPEPYVFVLRRVGFG
jgi:hypothetical protein